MSSEAQSWANKRKVAMERAALLREQRKQGVGLNEEKPTFAPQINKRPSYLKQDSLDELAGDIPDSNDIFEQPLPGARGAQALKKEYSASNMPSPGSDTLGKEMKRYPSGPSGSTESQPVQYKSKFLQQYSDQSSELDHQQQPQQYSRQQAQVENYNTPVKKQEDADEIFMSSLRGNNSGSGKKAVPAAFSSGPGWNDDVSSAGFGPPPKIKSNSKPARVRAQDTVPSGDGYAARFAQKTSGPSGGTGGGSRNRTTQQQQEWNMDTEVDYNAPAAALPPKSPRAAPSSRVPTIPQRVRTDSAGVAVAAQPNLSLLKSKIRRSGSGQNMQSMTMQSSGSSLGSSSAYEDQYATEQVAEIKRNGRRSAPNPSFPSSGDGPPMRNPRSVSSATNSHHDFDDHQRQRNHHQQYQHNHHQQQVDNEEHYEPTILTQRPRVRDPPQRQQQQQQQYEPSAPPRKSVADSRWDNNDPDPFGPDAYPPGAAPGIPDEAEYDPSKLMQCPTCERKFMPLPYSKHIKICEKVFQQKRKVFNSTKMRLTGTGDPEMEKLAAAAAKAAAKQAAIDKRNAAQQMQKQALQQQAQQQQLAAASKFAPAAAAKGPSSKPKNMNDEPVGGGGGGNAKWKAESNAFREAMKAARQYNKAKAEGKPLPPPVASAPDPSLMPCPHCGRSFNEKAAQRHIPQCQNIKAKPTMLKRGAGGGGGVNGTLSTTGSTKAKQRGFMG